MTFMQLAADEITRDAGTLKARIETLIRAASVDDGELCETVEKWTSLFKKIGDYRRVEGFIPIENEAMNWYFDQWMPLLYARGRSAPLNENMTAVLRRHVNEQRLEWRAVQWLRTVDSRDTETTATKARLASEIETLRGELKDARQFEAFEFGQKAMKEIEIKISQASAELHEMSQPKLTVAQAQEAMTIFGDIIYGMIIPEQSALERLWKMEPQIKAVLATVVHEAPGETKKRTSTRQGPRASKARQQFQPVAAA